MQGRQANPLADLSKKRASHKQVKARKRHKAKLLADKPKNRPLVKIRRAKVIISP